MILGFFLRVFLVLDAPMRTDVIASSYIVSSSRYTILRGKELNLSRDAITVGLRLSNNVDLQYVVARTLIFSKYDKILA